MKKTLIIISLLFLYNAAAQTDFSNENILIKYDENQSHDIQEIFSSDLNGDGFKELFVIQQRVALWYKNINGDIRYENAHIIDNTMTDGRSIYVADMNNDNIKEIITADRYQNKISLFQNTGNESFTASTIINVNLPLSVVADDINNDGYNDIIVASNSYKAVVYYLNDGNGAFNEQQTLFTSNNGALRTKLFDIDNDGLMDIFSTLYDGRVNLNKNLGNGIFAEALLIGTSASITTFDFLDINNDGYFDMLCNLYDKVSYRLNLNGTSFGDATPLTSTEYPIKIIAMDIDNDQLSDITISTSDNTIEWYKNNGDSSFTQTNVICEDNVMSTIKAMIIEDLNNDGIYEIIASSFSSEAHMKKLSYFNFNSATNSYDEEIINRYLGGVQNVRIGDLNNDGLNDIVSGYGNIVWNKNMGNGNFSSYHQVSNTNTDYPSHRIELADMNNDGFLDVVATNSQRLEIYKNDGQGKFNKAYSQIINNQSLSHKITDINGDNIPDILLTFISGNIKLGIINGLGNFSYSSTTPVNFTNSYYEPKKISCGDIDNDGDVDIAVSSFEKSAIQWLENNGSGNFEMHQIASAIGTDAITLADMDNDGQLDIITSTSENSYTGSGVSYLKNDNGVFSLNNVDPEQTLSSLVIADINQDGVKDIIGASYEDIEDDEKLICYIASGNTFQKFVVNSLGSANSYQRDVDVADLNNDNKLDIVTSYYYLGNVNYFINSTVLGFDDFEKNEALPFALYPNPFDNRLYWDATNSLYDLSIYDITGKELYKTTNYDYNYIDLSILPKGIYIIKFSGQDKNFMKKIIKK